MALDVPWGTYFALSELLEGVARADIDDAHEAASVIIGAILDVADDALVEARATAATLDNGVKAYIDTEVTEAMNYFDAEIDLIYDQLDIWLEEVEEWITLLISDITTSIEENVGMSEENIEVIGTVIGDNIGVGIEETGSWIGNVYDNVKTSIYDSMATLVGRLGNLVEMITNAPQIVINKMATELIPAEAGQWLLTAGNVLTGSDMGQWFGNFKGVITSAGDELLEFDTEDVLNNFIESFKLMKAKLPELLG